MKRTASSTPHSSDDVVNSSTVGPPKRLRKSVSWDAEHSAMQAQGRLDDGLTPTANAGPPTPHSTTSYDTDDAPTPMADAPTPEASNRTKKTESNKAPDPPSQKSTSAPTFEEAATPRPPQEQRSAKGAGGDFTTWDVGDRYEVGAKGLLLVN